MTIKPETPVDISSDHHLAITRRDFLKLLGLGTGGLILGYLIRSGQSWENVVRVINALQGNSVDCSPPSETKADEFSYDAIVIPGGGIDITLEGYNVPNEYQQLRLEAAAYAYIDHQASRIVLLDGNLDSRIPPNTNKVWLQQRVRQLSGNQDNLPDEAVIYGNESTNTATGAKEMADLANLYQFKRILLITNEFHLPRAQYYACYYGLNSTPQAAEAVIVDQDPTRAKYIDWLYNKEPITKRLLMKEKLALIATLIDPAGNITTFLRALMLP